MVPEDDASAQTKTNQENELNAEQIAKLKEVALRAPKNPGEWPFYLRSFQAAASPAVILELIALAERALLAAAPTPIQQVPTAWCTDAHFEAWCERHDMRKDHSDHRQMFDDAASLYLTVPSPQPELGGSIDTPKADPVVDRWALEKAICAGEVDPEHCVYKRSDVVEIIKLLRTAAPAPQPQTGGGIDTDEFSKLSDEVSMLWLQDQLRYVHAREKLVTHIDAWKAAACAVAREEGRSNSTGYAIAKAGAEELAKVLQRATDAESKLAAIREGVATMICWVTNDDGELCQAVDKVAGIRNPEQAMVRLSSLLALIQPPSQSDTNGLLG